MTARGIHTCCPEAPSTINVTVNNLELDGETALFVEELFVGTDVTSRTLTLTYTPYESASVHVMLNSTVMRPTFDYTVVADKIVFTFDVDSDDNIHVRYLRVGGGTVSIIESALAVGTLVGYGSATTPPDGWLLMDGTTKVYQSVYPELYTHLAANTHLTDGSGDDTPGSGVYYILKSISTSYYDGATLVTGNTIIKT